ncbi:MAG TPA: hypothetical protein VFU47_08105 [Armatimonadota bacterium]|nr:hypothetical protein [Armatimonadota bacterium]
MKPRVWLVLEFHCHLPAPDQASIWISARPLSPDRDLAEDVGRKLAGPLPYPEAQRLVELLRGELEAAGVDVVMDSAADD